MNEYLKELIKQTKEENKLTYKTISAEAGVPYGSLRNFLCGFRGISAENEQKLKNYLAQLEKKGVQ